MKDEDFYSMQYALEELGAFVLVMVAVLAVLVLIALVVKRFV